MKIIILFPFIAIIFLNACSNSNSKSSASFDMNKAPFLAQNEDTVDNYQVALLESNKFYYTHIRKDSLLETKEYFQGKYLESGDTIFLDYKKDRHLIGATKYLIKEIQRNYFIQYFNNGKKRIFLRIRKTSFRHRLLNY